MEATSRSSPRRKLIRFLGIAVGALFVLFGLAMLFLKGAEPPYLTNVLACLSISAIGGLFVRYGLTGRRRIFTRKQ
jgi:uncharacterized membrane protein